MDRRREVQHGGLAGRPDGRKPSGDGEPVWLTPHPRDLNQPEEEKVSIMITNPSSSTGSQV